MSRSLRRRRHPSAAHDCLRRFGGWGRAVSSVVAVFVDCSSSGDTTVSARSVVKRRFFSDVLSDDASRRVSVIHEEVNINDNRNVIVFDGGVLFVMYENQMYTTIC